MRIWLVQTGEELPMDGPATRLLRTALLAQELSARGHDVTYINATFNHQRKIQRSLDSQFVPAHSVPGQPYQCVLLKGRAYRSNVSIDRFLSHRENAAAFEKIADELPNPDVILCGFPPIELADAVTRYARRRGIKCALDCRDMWPEVIEERAPAPIRPFAHKVLSPLYRQKQRALANSDALTGITDAFVAWGLDGAGRAAKPLDRAFHLTVSPTDFDPEVLALGRRAWDEFVGTDHQKAPIIGCFAGTFASRTDIMSIIDGANLLNSDQRSRVRVVMCGKGDLAAAMADRARGNPAIVIPGWRNGAEIAALMARSDFGILPYPNTPDFLASYPNKVGEYLLAGLPIMTGLAGVTGKLLDDEGLSLRYTPGSAISVSERLTQLLAQPINAATRMHAKAVGEAHFDPKKIYPAFANWLEQLADFDCFPETSFAEGQPA